MHDFHGKVAVVTGAASGIGRALAAKSVHEGMQVVLADVEEHALKQAAEELQASGAQVLAVRTDVSQADAVEALAQKTYDTFGAMHLLFNNAGVIIADTTVWKSSLADWQWVLEVNLWGGIHGSHFFVPRMLPQDSEGHILTLPRFKAGDARDRRGMALEVERAPAIPDLLYAMGLPGLNRSL